MKLYTAWACWMDGTDPWFVSAYSDGELAEHDGVPPFHVDAVKHVREMDENVRIRDVVLEVSDASLRIAFADHTVTAAVTDELPPGPPRLTVVRDPQAPS